MRNHKLTPVALAIVSLLFTLGAHAQQSSATDEPATGEPAGKAQKQDRVEVKGKNTDVEERRNSSAAKIIISREDIEQYGDTNLGDVMRRLPGVTTGGRPGRGGAPRMRGMSGGYTQILINSERIPPGFSIEDISPDQVERIEILRAPTAETGARAIAGTINIILREPLRSTSDELKGGLQFERGRVSPNTSWTHNDVMGDTGTYNLTVSLNRNETLTDTKTHTEATDLTTNATTLSRDDFNHAESIRNGVFTSGRFQWRLGQGESFSLQPFFVHNQGHTTTTSDLSGSVGTLPYTESVSDVYSTVNVARLNSQLMKRLDPQTRLEMSAGLGSFRLNSNTDTVQTSQTGLMETINENTKDFSWSFTGKVSHNFISGHSLVTGLELENAQRDDTTITADTYGANPQTPRNDTLNANTRRTALYIQDEWDPAETVSANLGLRWESIKTQADAISSAQNVSQSFSNESRVLTPVGHLVWRFASPRKDQIRFSLSETYKPPTLQNLAAPVVRNSLALTGSNTFVNPDRGGNPALQPELAKGFDLAYERYLDSGGIASVNLFQRNITDLIRNVIAQETQADGVTQRWVSRPQNIGNAVTRGVEFDAKFRLNEIVDNAPAVNLRANVSIYRSNVSDITGPYNRIDQQPAASGNLGADYRFPKSMWTLGGNFSLIPSYTIQLSNQQAQVVGMKRVIDLYSILNVTPNARVRFGLSNAAALDSLNSTSAITTDTTTHNPTLMTTNSVGRTDVQASVRIEVKLK